MSASLKASADGLSASLQVGGVDQATFGAGIQLSHRNRIINGAFQINQRVVSGTVTLTAGQYGHDRWKAGASGCTYTFATSGGLTTLTISAGSLQQVIEDVNVPFGTNTLCMSWAGTAQGKIAAGSYATSGVTASVTGGSNLTVEFGTGTLTKVQIEVGPSATPFEQRQLNEELARCQRYFFRFGGSGQTIQSIQLVQTGNLLDGLIVPPQPLRVLPTISQSSWSWASGSVSGNQIGAFDNAAGGWLTSTNASIAPSTSPALSNGGISFRLTGTGGAFGGADGRVHSLNMGGSAYFDFSAEL